MSHAVEETAPITTPAPTPRAVRRIPAVRMVQSSRWARTLANRLLVALIAIALGLVFLPWQQNVKGIGRVVAYAPLERQFVVKSAIKGRVVEWMKGIQENVYVNEGDPIVRVEDVAPEYEGFLEQKMAAAQDKVARGEEMVASYADQVKRYEALRDQTADAADRLIKVAGYDLEAAAAGLTAAKADLFLKEQNYSRKKSLYEKDIKSQYDFQLAQQEFQLAQAKLEQAENYKSGAVEKLEKEKIERGAKLSKSEAEIREAQAKFQKAQSELAVSRKELADEQSHLQRYQQGMLVKAPRSGYIFKLLANQGGEIVKEGDPLAILVPQADERAAELHIDGNDIPLIHRGAEVRLQFEGYPAVQFTPGWPRAALGTFGGKVEIIDSTDDGNGRFRIVVLPDEVGWPDERFTRQGVRATGWVLLSTVPLGYELWRRLNGFPPILVSEKPKEGEATGKSKPPIPK